MEANIRTSSCHALEERRLARQLAQPVAFKPFHVRALWGFEARMPEELGFRQGDIITVAEPIEGDGWKRPASRSGWVFLFELRRGDANSVAPELLATPITLHPGNADARRFTASPFLPRQSQKKRLAHLWVPVFL